MRTSGWVLLTAMVLAPSVIAQDTNGSDNSSTLLEAEGNGKNLDVLVDLPSCAVSIWDG
jgi:hypothetical protein